MIPQLLIIDDLFGRRLAGARNPERANLCGQYLIEDLTGDEPSRASSPRVKQPIAQAVFWRGQQPQCSRRGDIVENDLEGTLNFIGQGWLGAPPVRPRWSLVLLDLCFYTGPVTEESDKRTEGMPEGRHDDDDPEGYFGLRILRGIKERFPDLPVVILSSKPREQVSREFSRLGALAFLARGEENAPELLKDYIWRHGLLPDDTGEIVGNSKALLLSLRAARRAALDRRNVLVRGERGTGKELLARYIHRQSIRDASRPFVTVDSGSLNPNLYSSELFGHVRGSFTGADRDRKGRIMQADGGDLFLDEVGNMPADVQMGLLRVLEQRELVPLGASQGQRVDVRFISATNEDLEGKAATGSFREDLVDRLRAGGTVFLRPLSERLEDIGLLVDRFVREAERAQPGSLRRIIEPETLELLRSHSWPGNLRELRNCIFDAVFTYPDVEHLVPVHCRVSPLEASAQNLESIPVPAVASGTVLNLDNLIAILDGFSFRSLTASDLLGRLPKLQRAYSRLAAGLLRAGLSAYNKPTFEHPEGEILIHPTVKFLTGDRTLTASTAADIVKRLFADPVVSLSLLEDPLLNAAHKRALQLRPRQQRRPRAKPN